MQADWPQERMRDQLRALIIIFVYERLGVMR
jgi:hypothetical protein